MSLLYWSDFWGSLQYAVGYASNVVHDGAENRIWRFFKHAFL